MTYRVVQWTTGNVGRKSVHAVVTNADLELVGCYAWSADKVGRDVGELCGLDPLGVLATDDVDSLLALEPDCVVYNPMFADVDVLIRILGSGINVVTTSEFITGHNLGADRERIAAACAQGGSTIFGSGINPGFIQLFAVVTAGLSDRVDRISILESFDTTIYNSPATETPMGFGYPVDHPDLQRVTEKGSAVSAKPCSSSRTRSVPTSTRSVATPPMPRPPKISGCPATGPSRPVASQGSTSGGRAGPAAGMSSRSGASGPKDSRCTRSGRPRSDTPSPSKEDRRSRAR